jgi:hypothetical protein
MADAHPGAADELLLDHLGVDDPAELVGARQPQHLDLAGLVIHGDVRDEAGVGEGRVGVHLPRFWIDRRERNQEDTAPCDGLALLELPGLRSGFHGDRARRRPADVDVAAPVSDEIGRVDLELLGCCFEQYAARLPRRRDDGVAHAVRPARGEAAHIVRAGVAVRGVHIDVLDRNPKGFSRKLPGDLFHALAEIDGGERDRELAVWVRMDERLARIPAEVHADRVVDGGHAPPFVPGHVSASAC